MTFSRTFGSNVVSMNSMRIIEFESKPFFVLPYLNAGHGAGGFYEEKLPFHEARVDRLPDGLSALIATADLQGRERFEDSPGGPIRLLGEALPRRLIDEILPSLSLHDPGRVGVLLAGDFYTVPNLDKRGGTGDVTSVWSAFAEGFAWVAGTPGNHDLWGESTQCRPRLSAGAYLVDGEAKEIGGLRIAGLGGIIGKCSRPNRRSEAEYMQLLHQIVQSRPDILMMHDGPCGAAPDQRGLSRACEILRDSEMGLVMRGHAHWAQPLAEFADNLQILNVAERVVILMA